MVLRIRDLPQNRGALRPGRRRHVRWPPVPRLVGQQGERSRFFCLGRQAELVRQANLKPSWFEFFSQHAHERAIFCAPARNDQLAKLLFRCRTNLRTACAMDRAVSAVAVATMSAFRARPHSLRNLATNSRPNSSRPAVFGGFCRKKGSRSKACATTLSNHVARCRDPAVPIIGLARIAFG